MARPLSTYSSQLKRFRSALSSLPSTLPYGSSIYDFRNWIPDPELREVYGAECSVLNAHLEIVFGLRAQVSLSFLERGPGIESLADLFTRYLDGDYSEKPVVAKWLDDLTEAAEAMGANATEPSSKRISKPSAAQKRSNKWLESTAEETATRKRARTAAMTKAQVQVKARLKTAQTCNWKHGFDDLEDVESIPKPYTTGRRGYAVVKELVIECRSRIEGKQRWRCLSNGCHQSWSSCQAQRLLEHATSECNLTNPDLQERATEQSGALSLGEKVAQLDLDAARTSSTESGSSGQSTLKAACTKEGQRAQQTRFDFNVVNFVSAAQLAPRKIDLPQFQTMISHANINLCPKSSSHIAHCQIPMESTRVRRDALKELKGSKNLTISFDGGTAVRPMSFTTIHVTRPDTRFAHLMKGIEASGVSHTGEYYFKELDKVIQEIGPLSFSGITYDSTGNTRLARELIHKCYPTIIILANPCHQLHNTIKDICNLDYFKEPHTSIPFASAAASSKALKNLARLDLLAGITHPRAFGAACQQLKKTAIHTSSFQNHKLAFFKNVSTSGEFKKRVIQLEKLTEPFAKAIKCLESGHSNPSNVFIFYMAVMATLRQLVDNNETELSLPHDVITQAQKSACCCYYSMVLASGQENHKIGTIVLCPNTYEGPGRDKDLHQAIPSFGKIGLFLKGVLCAELDAGTIACAKDYDSASAIVKIFKTQVAAYARGEHPFEAQTADPTTFDTHKSWRKLANHPDACFIAPIAEKMLSVVPNSMAEERTVSCFSKLNSKDRSCQKVSTLVHMTRIRQSLLRKPMKAKPTFQRLKPVLKFRDLSSTLLQQHAPVVASTKVNEPEPNKVKLPKGWLWEDAEQPDNEAVDPVQVDNVDECDTADSDIPNDDDDTPEDVEPESQGFHPDEAYGVDLMSPILLDLLSDQAMERVETGSIRKVDVAAIAAKAGSSAKKDTSGVDLEEY
ncbi:hypothetical protein BDV93DRAFT_513341 [Ceratobasidium sp. AG-I]|nr:hypothetical protein BDV93DRAFT_513341 [Ceratobasidium sp. AG-I]